MSEAKNQDTQPEKCTICVVGATPAGIAAAVRTSREGLDTILISYYQHIGGVL